MKNMSMGGIRIWRSCTKSLDVDNNEIRYLSKYINRIVADHDEICLVFVERILVKDYKVCIGAMPIKIHTRVFKSWIEVQTL